VVLGVTTNLALLRAVIDHPAFREGAVDTHFLQRHSIAISRDEPPDEALIAAALACRTTKYDRPAEGGDRSASPTAGPWADAGHWRMC
jgi:3-methylcrotonyl-CoA carboxylase alpha subunit